MSVEHTDVIVKLPEPVARRGITEAQWRTLANNLYPGASSESVIMVWDYCVARKLDPLKKPCHIVPMQVKDAKTGDYNWRDVVMPGIYEYRTTATRTGLYLGHSKPEYGLPIDFMDVRAPEWCDITVYRWNIEAKIRAEYPVRVMFSEVAATTYDKKNGTRKVNSRWTVAPLQMMTKCAEAAALREAFPDELGGTHTVEEMEGKVVEHEVSGTRVDPRGDLSGVDFELANRHVSVIADILAQDKDEYDIADDLRNYVEEHLARFNELYISVRDKLKDMGVVKSKTDFDKYLKLFRTQEARQHGV